MLVWLFDCSSIYVCITQFTIFPVYTLFQYMSVFFCKNASPNDSLQETVLLKNLLD